MNLKCICFWLKKRLEEQSDNEGRGNLVRKIATGLLVGFIIVVFGYFAYVRPHIAVTSHQNTILGKNSGKATAFIYKVDLFLYRSGRISFVGNMPEIRQTIDPQKESVLFKVPNVLASSPEILEKQTSYMKMTIRYGMPGIPFFRYTSLFYFRYSQEYGDWDLVETIPAKYRSLGQSGKGNIDQIQLEFQ